MTLSLFACGASVPNTTTPGETKAPVETTDPSTPPEEVSNMTALSGTIVDWVAYPGRTRRVFLDVDMNLQLTLAVVQTNGQFNLPLPSAQQLQPYLKDFNAMPANPDCTYTLKSSNATSRVFFTSNLEVYDVQEESVSGNVRLYGEASGGAQQMALWTYATEATTLSGSERCVRDGYTYNMTFDARIPKGWSAMTQEIVESSLTLMSSTVRSGRPDGEVWKYF
ncbi:hypothetical protein Deipe_3846 (plasmid) [Deinococcus peraridilitoris DSM 19664]|uniref:Uncharacterized protein n=2 Tax=Deinococcus TaxID=1298 RepID=L0A5Z0_DEIPD|nr:hypothetical protein Deipe_3846 [Deinococcus peraridilitoris DSM 19664]